VIPDPAETPTVSVEQAGEWLGLGRSSAYEAARRGEIPTLRFGRSLRVPTARLRVLLGLDPEPEGDSPAARVLPLRREAGG
jgi:excisionase family DNA binding protein